MHLSVNHLSTASFNIHEDAIHFYHRLVPDICYLLLVSIHICYLALFCYLLQGKEPICCALLLAKGLCEEKLMHEMRFFWMNGLTHYLHSWALKERKYMPNICRGIRGVFRGGGVSRPGLPLNLFFLDICIYFHFFQKHFLNFATFTSTSTPGPP